MKNVFWPFCCARRSHTTHSELYTTTRRAYGYQFELKMEIKHPLLPRTDAPAVIANDKYEFPSENRCETQLAHNWILVEQHFRCESRAICSSFCISLFCRAVVRDTSFVGTTKSEQRRVQSFHVIIPFHTLNFH